MSSHFNAIIDYEDSYVQPLLLAALQSRLSKSSYALLDPTKKYNADFPLLQVQQYEKIDFERAVQHPSTHLINSYVIRKALIRKHYLSTTISNWTSKHESSVLKTHFMPALEFELDYAEFLDDALIEAFELHESFKENEGKNPADRDWWILKPGMSDRGQGIRLFSTFEELEEIFQRWEDEGPDSDDEQDDNIHGKSGIITSQLRHFVAQPYISSPLLLETEGNRKFHIRTYVMAVGALKVYVYKPMLALFAPEPYVAPGSQPGEEAGTSHTDIDLRAHLTNTCLQETDAREGNVKLFWDLDWDQANKDSVFEQIRLITGELFEAAARGMMVHFQPLPNAFELFGLDFLIDTNGTAWLLETNAFPDFRQTGDDLRGVVEGVFEDVVDVAIKPFFGLGDDAIHGTDRMCEVLDIDLGRR